MNIKNFKINAENGLDLVLRTADDAEAFFNLTDKNRKYLRPWLAWVDATKTSEDTKNYIKKGLENFQNKESLDLGMWYENQWVGSIGLDLDMANRKGMIGYWISEEFAGKGLTTRAVRTMIDYGFKVLGLNRIVIRCAPDNKRSRAIPEKLGFTNEGTLRDAEWVNDHFVDHVGYSILAREWK